MALTSEFYLARAAECARDADASKLENVRDRNRRAEAAWLAMAGQSALREAERDALIAEKATKAEASESEAEPSQGEAGPSQSEVGDDELVEEAGDEEYSPVREAAE